MDVPSDHDDVQKQTEESRSNEKKLRDERDRYLFLYNRTNERFLAFELKQVDQIRRIVDYFTSNTERTPADLGDERRTPRTMTNLSASNLLPSSFNHPLAQFEQTEEALPEENRWDRLMSEIDELLNRTEKFAEKLRELSLNRLELEKEQKLRREIEEELKETKQIIEQDRSKRLQKLRNYATLADDEGDILLSSLMKKAEKNDLDFRDTKFQFEKVFLEQIDEMKKLIKEREVQRLYIQRLERENAALAAMNRSDETVQLLTRSAIEPTTFPESVALIGELREEVLQQMKLREKFRHDLEHNEHNYKLDLREREQIEELLNRDLTAARDEIVVLQSVRSEYERMIIVKTDLEKQLEECQNELKSLRDNSTASNEQRERLSGEKDALIEENTLLRAQVQKLRIDFENSESVQYDFVKLSQQLQMQLEEFRNSENELRWQPEEDFNECQRCRNPFSVTVRRHRCRHCGKVLCKECTSKIVHTGPNHRPSRVCDVCYTLLVKTSQPYFLAGAPKD